MYVPVRSRNATEMGATSSACRHHDGLQDSQIEVLPETESLPETELHVLLNVLDQFAHDARVVERLTSFISKHCDLFTTGEQVCIGFDWNALTMARITLVAAAGSGVHANP